jgi:PAS domain S-box-containing protein
MRFRVPSELTMALPDTRQQVDLPGGELEQLRSRLQEAEDTLLALRNGEVDAIVVGEDIYTLESAEAATNRFRSDVLAQMQDAVIATDLRDNVVYLNAAAERQYGLAASQVLGLPLHHLYRPIWLGHVDENAALRQRTERGHWRGRLRHVTRAGSSLLVECTFSRLHDSRGELSGTLAVIRDVSVQAAAEAALGESRARLQFALDSARIGEWDIAVWTSPSS